MLKKSKTWLKIFEFKNDFIYLKMIESLSLSSSVVLLEVVQWEFSLLLFPLSARLGMLGLCTLNFLAHDPQNNGARSKGPPSILELEYNISQTRASIQHKRTTA